mgnify:CR=1 FL=1
MPNYEVHYLDVSDADSIIIRYDDGRKQYIVLIDAGNVEDSAKIKNYIWNHYNKHKCKSIKIYPVHIFPPP